ncbi:hypothetical protein DH2020_037863 [Rehmannia glutinosa]|uniref:Peptidase A1 domain-containing protein n=1 Tax=Rehmannia glutinosa TaxID=99300 RepID=A0ABR0V0D7_REHGL
MSSYLLILALLVLFVSPHVSTSRTLLDRHDAKMGFRVALNHVDSGGNFTKLELLQRAMKRGKKRMHRLYAMALAKSDPSIESPIHAGNGEFLMELAIGTPPSSYSAILDTGSDLIWTQCKPCKQCFNQKTPIFDPKKSSSFSKLPCASDLCTALPLSSCSVGNCEYLYTYGDYSSTQGIMATETFTFGDVSVPKVGFGCGLDNEGGGFNQGGGLVGLGRGPLSLVSQLDEPKFSYWITVGDTVLPINKSTFALKGDGTGGMIIDSGTTITYIEESAFDIVKKEFINQVKLPVDESNDTGLDLCFTLPSDARNIEVPKMIFHFDGADLDLPGENYIIADQSGVACLAMGGSNGMSIFGNIQQQNILVVHDLVQETISFVPTKCDQL